MLASPVASKTFFEFVALWRDRAGLADRQSHADKAGIGVATVDRIIRDVEQNGGEAMGARLEHRDAFASSIGFRNWWTLIERWQRGRAVILPIDIVEWAATQGEAEGLDASEWLGKELGAIRDLMEKHRREDEEQGGAPIPMPRPKPPSHPGIRSGSDVAKDTGKVAASQSDAARAAAQRKGRQQ